MVTCGHVEIFYDVYISLLTSVLWSCIQKVIVPILIQWREYIIFTLLSGLSFSDNRKKLPKYAQISRLPLQYKLKWSMMKDFSSENNWTNFAVSVRKTLHVIDLLSILTTLTWSSTFPLDFAILFKLKIFVVKQKLVEKLIHWPVGRRNEFVFCTFMSDLLFPWKPSGGVAIGPKLPLPWQPPPSKQWKLLELDRIDVWQV